MKSFLKNILFLIILINTNTAFSQRKINFVLSIDEQIVGGSIMNIKIICSKGNLNTIHDIDYFPGELLIPDSTVHTILNGNFDSITMKFSYTVMCKENQNVSNYEIAFNKSWIDNYYTVVSIFNTNNRRYRGKFILTSSKTYVYDIFYPGGASKTLRKGNKKMDCDVMN